MKLDLAADVAAVKATSGLAYAVMGRMLWALLGGVLGTVAVFLWMHWHRPASAPIGVSAPYRAPIQVPVAANPAPEVRHQGRVSVPIQAKQILAYRPEIKRQLPLPEAIKADPDQAVVAASEVAKDDHAHRMVVVQNTQDGHVQVLDTRLPLPWLAFDHETEAGAYVGLANGQPAMRMTGRWDAMQVKAVHFGAVASVDLPLVQPGVPGYFLGVGLWTRF